MEFNKIKHPYRLGLSPDKRKTRLSGAEFFCLTSELQVICQIF